MFSKNRFVASAGAAAFISAAMMLPMAASAHEAETDSKAAFEEGLRLYRAGSYSESLNHLRLAANYGETNAAAMIGAMYLAGEGIYGAGVPTDPVQARNWLQVASIKSRQPADVRRQAVAVAPAAVR